MTKLSLAIIEKYNLPKKSVKPDWDDAGFEFTLPSGIDLMGYFMINGEPCDTDCLEGMDGMIYIDTEEELKEYIGLSYDEIILKIANVDDNF